MAFRNDDILGLARDGWRDKTAYRFSIAETVNVDAEVGGLEGSKLNADGAAQIGDIGIGNRLAIVIAEKVLVDRESIPADAESGLPIIDTRIFPAHGVEGGHVSRARGQPLDIDGLGS